MTSMFPGTVPFAADTQLAGAAMIVDQIFVCLVVAVTAVTLVGLLGMWMVGRLDAGRTA
jgi:hypothetical protein